MRNLRFGLLLLLAAVICTSSWAEDLYVKNKAFKGHSTGSGSSMMVEVEAMLKALGISDYTITDDQLVVNDKTLSVQAGAEGPMISLKALTEAIGAKVVHNSGLGTIDVYQGAEKRAAAPSSTKAAAAELPPVVKAAQSSPGGTVVLEDYMAYGKKNIVYFYADW